MNVRELIAMLRNLPQKAHVRAWDADADSYMPVTGAVFDDYSTFVDLQTDSDEEEDPRTPCTPSRELFTIETPDARGEWHIEEHFRDRILAEDQLDWLRKHYPDKTYEFLHYIGAAP